MGREAEKEWHAFGLKHATRHLVLQSADCLTVHLLESACQYTDELASTIEAIKGGARQDQRRLRPVETCAFSSAALIY